MFGFCNPDFKNRALIASAVSFKVNKKDSFRRDNCQDFPPVIILSSINDKVHKVQEKVVRVKVSKIVLNILQNDTFPQCAISKAN